MFRKPNSAYLVENAHDDGEHDEAEDDADEIPKPTSFRWQMLHFGVGFGHNLNNNNKLD